MSAPRYARWVLTARRWRSPGVPGWFETRARLVPTADPSDVLLLSERRTRRSGHDHDTWRDRVELGAIVADGAPLDGPDPAVVAEVRTLRPDGTVLATRRLSANELYRLDDLAAAPADARSYFAAKLDEVIGYLDDPAQPAWRWSGANVLTDRATLFAWHETGDDLTFAREDQAWVPGHAGPHERVLMGSGLPGLGFDVTQRSNWLLYALGSKLIVEFWRNGDLIANRMLECGHLPHAIDDDARYVIAVGYDFEVGRISLGVSARNGGGTVAYQSWLVPELEGFGFEQEEFHVGGTVMYTLFVTSGPSEVRTAWGLVKPIRGAFASERVLSRGLLSELMEGV